ncbi:MAG: PIN domain-containing protein [Solirubrobacterales bacterium]
MAEPPLGEGRYLIDNSAYARAADPAVAPIWAAALRADRLVSSGPFVIEALYSARNGEELAETLEELTEGVPYLDADAATWKRAHRAQAQMAAVAPQFHRRPPVDFLIAALADRHGLGVLHCDRDYDLLAEHSGLRFESRWAVPPGSLGDAGSDPLRPFRRAVSARLAQFAEAEAQPIFERVIAVLDEEIARAGKQPLRPVSQS